MQPIGHEFIIGDMKDKIKQDRNAELPLILNFWVFGIYHGNSCYQGSWDEDVSNGELKIE